VKYALWTLAVIAGVAIVVVIFGSLLPKNHVAARYILVHQKPEQVFALISDVQSGASWRSEVQAVEILPSTDGHVRFREKMKHGAITMEVLEARPPERLVTQIADKSLPFGGIWIMDISPAPDGCRMNITERGEVSNPIFRFVSRFVLGYTNTMDTYLRNVAHKFGENAEPQDGAAATQ
jgi:hypothetical protein